MKRTMATLLVGLSLILAGAIQTEKHKRVAAEHLKSAPHAGQFEALAARNTAR